MKSLSLFQILTFLLFALHLVLWSSESAKPVKVFILSGQSNMVGAGKVDGGSSRRRRGRVVIIFFLMHCRCLFVVVGCSKKKLLKIEKKMINEYEKDCRFMPSNILKAFK